MFTLRFRINLCTDWNQAFHLVGTLHLECVPAELWNKSSCHVAFCMEKMIFPCDIYSKKQTKKTTPHLLSLMLLSLLKKKTPSYMLSQMRGGLHFSLKYPPHRMDLQFLVEGFSTLTFFRGVCVIPRCPSVTCGQDCNWPLLVLIAMQSRKVMFRSHLFDLINQGKQCCFTW